MQVASLGELAQALHVGFSPDEIVFDSPAKTSSELRYELLVMDLCNSGTGGSVAFLAGTHEADDVMSGTDSPARWQAGALSHCRCCQLTRKNTTAT